MFNTKKSRGRKMFDGNDHRHHRCVGGIISFTVGFVFGMFCSVAWSTQPVYINQNGYRMVARAYQTQYEIYTGEEFEPRFLKGVNIGATLPGQTPGYIAINDENISKSDFLRWFDWVAEMNCDLFRVYTLMPPHFYEAVEEFNADREVPLLFMQSIWPDNEILEVTEMDAYETIDFFKLKVDEVLGAVHGAIEIPFRYGESNGNYTFDVARYCVGYVMGAEWLSTNIAYNNELHKDHLRTTSGVIDIFRSGPHAGTPYESFLAEVMDYLVVQQQQLYGWEHPITFTNWPSTDPMRHPYEPFPDEDNPDGSLNFNHFVFDRTRFEAGLFGFYHVYPYYPDFMNYTPWYQEYYTKDGTQLTYGAYLTELRRFHAHIPVLIGELGVPSSRGLAHHNYSGLHQGGHNHTEQGNYNLLLVEQIAEHHLSGALLFNFQDEWFKSTWNTMDMVRTWVPDDSPTATMLRTVYQSDLGSRFSPKTISKEIYARSPDRRVRFGKAWTNRALWHNALTNEQYFGMLAMVAGTESTRTHLDDTNHRFTAEHLLIDSTSAYVLHEWDDGYDESRQIQQLSVTSDAEYVYLKIDVKHLDPQGNGTLDWDQVDFVIAIDVIPGQGQLQIPSQVIENYHTNEGTDFLIWLRDPEQSEYWVDSHYDPFAYLYTQVTWAQNDINAIYHEYDDVRHLFPTDNNGVFNLYRLATSRALHIKDKVIPFEVTDTGRLRYGSTDPNSPVYDSLADFYASVSGSFLLVRIPWMMLNVIDPSTRTILANHYGTAYYEHAIAGGQHGYTDTYFYEEATTPGISFVVLTTNPSDRRPASVLASNADGSQSDFSDRYVWDTWICVHKDHPNCTPYYEVLKESYPILQNGFANMPRSATAWTYLRCDFNQNGVVGPEDLLFLINQMRQESMRHP